MDVFNVTTAAPATSSSHITGVMIFSCVVFGVAGVIGTAGNVMTLVTLARYKPFQSSERVLFANLAISDMVVTVIADPMSIVAKTLGWRFFSEIQPLCVLVGAICTVSCIVSLLSIATIGLNRYLIVCHSMRQGLAGTRVQCGILCVIYGWALVVVMMTFVGFGRHGFNHNNHMCLLVQEPETANFMVFFVVVCLWTPMLITMLSYWKLYHCVSMTRKRVLETMKMSKLSSKKNVSNESVKLAKTAFIIFFIFVLCWFPFSILFLAGRRGGVNGNVSILLTTLAHLHPSLNFFIYYNTNVKFRKAVRKLISVSSDPSSERSVDVAVVNTVTSEV